MSIEQEKTVIVPFRAPAALKKRIRTAALLNGQNVSEYIRERLEPIVRRDIMEGRREILAEAA